MPLDLVYKPLERGQFKLAHMDPSSMAVEIDATRLDLPGREEEPERRRRSSV